LEQKVNNMNVSDPATFHYKSESLIIKVMVFSLSLNAMEETNIDLSIKIMSAYHSAINDFFKVFLTDSAGFVIGTTVSK